MMIDRFLPKLGRVNKPFKITPKQYSKYNSILMNVHFVKYWEHKTIIIQVTQATTAVRHAEIAAVTARH